MGLSGPLLQPAGPFPHQLGLIVPQSPRNLYRLLERTGKLHGEHGILYLEGVDEYTGGGAEYFQSCSQLLKEER